MVVTPENDLARARDKRDNVFISIKNIHATALAARNDADRIPSLIIRAEDLNRYIEQFQHQQDVIINALIYLDRIAEFVRYDRPLVISMEIMRLEIKTLVASLVPASDSEIQFASSSSTVSTTQHFGQIPKIQLPSFDGSVFEWRSFRDIYISLVHDNTGISDAERFHYLLSCLSGDALAVVKSIPLSANNYALAWKALSVRFDNRRLKLASAHLDKLFAFKTISHRSLPALTLFVNTFKENVAVIKALSVIDLSSFLMFHMGSRVLDPTTIELFESSAAHSTITTFDELVNFVQHQCRVLENINNVSTPYTTVKPHVKFKAPYNSTVVLGVFRDAWDQVHSVRVLLDSGSQISAMTSDCVTRLGLYKRRFKSDLVGLSKSPVNHVQGVTSCQFSSRFNSELFPSVDLVIIIQITAAMSYTRLPASVRLKYQHLCLADNNFDIPSRVDALFGTDILPSLVRPYASVEHNPDFPSALDTQLGWIVFGSFSTPTTSSLATTTTAVIPPSIGELLQTLWLVEEPAAPTSPTTEDKWCEQYFNASTSHDSTGRFCVALPFRHLFTGSAQHQDASPHGHSDSHSIALKRFYNLEKRLSKDAVLYTAYRKFMSTYKSLGHMVSAPSSDTYFIPNHTVLKADGGVYEIRVVFDASSTSSSGRSLNDVLCIGPKIKVDLRAVLGLI